VGTTPIGAPIVGALADQAGPRASLALGALACAAAALVGIVMAHRARSATQRASSSTAQEAAEGRQPPRVPHTA
jgi:hypothetical protein